MNRLWVRLSLAFGLVTLTAIIIAALLANYQVSAEFRQFVTHGQMIDTVAPELVQYYAVAGSWEGVETVVANLPGPGMGQAQGQGRGMRRGAPSLLLADASGRVLYDSAGSRQGDPLSRAELAGAVPLEWQAKTVGYLLPAGRGQSQLPASAQLFLDRVNLSLFQAALIAGILGLLIGVVIARGLTAPLGRLAAAARRISQGRLEERVPVNGAEEFVELAEAFNEMAANLQQAETLRRNLVADIAHELRTPLSIIQGNLQAILEDIYPLEKAEIASIYDETLILNRLISDLRELVQAEAGQLSLDLQPTDLAPTITTVVDLFSELAREQEIELTTDLPLNLPLVQADEHRLRQVFHNLLANALRHTPAGGQVTVAVDGPPKNGSGQPDTAAFLRVSVADTGPGIPSADLPHVFDRFWRADKSRSREQGGSGLGLAIARQLVEAHGGHIGVESEGVPGHGSRFWFTLPVVSR
jgi:two-component system OmpR family sensor kinase/two-component system sensor histidine kinase BaeS